MSDTVQILQPPPPNKKNHIQLTISSYIKITPSYIHIIAVKNISILHIWGALEKKKKGEYFC